MPPETTELPAPAVKGPGAAPPETDPVTQTLALLQPWIDYVPQKQRRLGLFIFFAVLLHLAAFFFIRIATIRAESWHQPRAHVSVETASAPAPFMASAPPGDAFWDRLTDPRLFLLSSDSPASLFAREPALDFTAINSDISSHELPAAALPADFQFVHPVVPSIDELAQASMNPSRQPFSYDEKPVPVAAKTTWQVDKALAQRQPTGMADLPSPLSDTELAPTVLNVAVSADGTVQHVLIDTLEKSSEDGVSRLDLDQQAITAARKIRFKPTDQPGLLWGRITVFWRYSANPRVEVVPTPPSGP